MKEMHKVPQAKKKYFLWRSNGVLPGRGEGSGQGSKGSTEFTVLRIFIFVEFACWDVFLAKKISLKVRLKLESSPVEVGGGGGAPRPWMRDQAIVDHSHPGPAGQVQSLLVVFLE